MTKSSKRRVTLLQRGLGDLYNKQKRIENDIIDTQR